MANPEHIGTILKRVFADLAKRYGGTDEETSETNPDADARPRAPKVDGNDCFQDFKPQRGLKPCRK